MNNFNYWLDNWLTKVHASEPDIIKLLLLFLPGAFIAICYQALEHGIWLIPFFICCALLRFSQALGQLKRISPLYKFGFMLIGGALVFQASGELGYLSALFLMLGLTLSLKILELNKSRDVLALTCLHLFLVGNVLLFYFALLHALLLAGVILLTVATLLQHFRPAMPMSLNIRHAFIYSLYATPVALTLFVLMPKLPPLWKMPSVTNEPSGIQDEVTPGDIAKLSQSAKLAFRVDFEDAVKPQQNALYWRALVLDKFDGRTWRQSHSLKAWQNYAKRGQEISYTIASSKGQSLSYQVIVEPTYQHYVYALDRAVAKTAGITQSPNFSLFSRKEINKRVEYQVESELFAKLEEPAVDWQLAINLNTAPNHNIKTQRWVSSLVEQGYRGERLAQYLLQWFNQQAFYYTLEPPLLGRNSVDDFLFTTKQGFCSHYASAFTLAMRLAGVPARMVVGYQGGEWNPQGGYLSVHHYDAHAWSEIWLPEQGWVRYDPTAAVAPERIESNLQELLASQQQDFLQEEPMSLVRFKDNKALNYVRFAFASLDYKWTRWILNYDKADQEALLQRLFGSDTHWAFYLRVLAGLVGVVLLVVAFMWYQQKNNQFSDKVSRLYHQLLQKLAQQGLRKPVGMTAAEFGVLVSEKYPTVAQEWQSLVILIDGLNYRNLSIEQRKALYKQLKLRVANISKQAK